jgi:hypothetical protein
MLSSSLRITSPASPDARTLSGSQARFRAIFPDAGLSSSFGAKRDDQEAAKKTDALLTSAQVAIYPIAPEGVVTDSLFSASRDVRQAQQPAAGTLQEAAQERNENHAGMDQIARYTGGEAFYGTNDLNDALARATDHGSHFYTLTYSSTDAARDGRFRRIQVKLATSGYQLAYRQGYYADDGKSAPAAPAQPAPKQSGDPLSLSCAQACRTRHRFRSPCASPAGAPKPWRIPRRRPGISRWRSRGRAAITPTSKGR